MNICLFNNGWKWSDSANGNMSLEGMSIFIIFGPCCHNTYTQIKIAFWLYLAFDVLYMHHNLPAQRATYQYLIPTHEGIARSEKSQLTTWVVTSCNSAASPTLQQPAGMSETYQFCEQDEAEFWVQLFSVSQFSADLVKPADWLMKKGGFRTFLIFQRWWCMFVCKEMMEYLF